MPIYAATTCSGLHGHVKVAFDGTVYVPNKACGGTALGGTVQDGGSAFAIQNGVFPAVVAGDDNRAAFVFLGTPTSGDFQSSTFVGVWHLYVVHTYDAARPGRRGRDAQ